MKRWEGKTETRELIVYAKDEATARVKLEGFAIISFRECPFDRPTPIIDRSPSGRPPGTRG